MEEADHLSDRVMILEQGEILMNDTVEMLKRNLYPPQTYDLCFQTPTADAYAQKLAPFIEKLEPFAATETQTFEENQTADRIRFQLKTPENLAHLLEKIRPEDFQSLGLTQTDLETIYLSVARRSASHSAVSQTAKKESN